MTLDQYKAQYEEEMRSRGISVTWAEDGGAPYSQDTGGWQNPENWIAVLSRDGVTSQSSVTLGRMQFYNDPASMARHDIQFSLQRAGQLGSPQGSVPSDFFTPIDDDTRRFYEVYPHLRPGYTPPTSNPGPSPTVNSHSTIQPGQSPADPANGTAVSTPHSNGTGALRFTFWEWNYYYQQQTGREGPSPEESTGVTHGNQVMTGAEWAAAVGAFYGAPVAAPPVTAPSAGGGVGTTPTTPSIPVGGSTSPGGGAPSNPVTTPVGGTPTAPSTPPPPTSGTLRSFWEWNALKEQVTGIAGDDPAHYGIEGNTMMTESTWKGLTAAYYAARTGSGGAGGAGGAKPTDNTMLYAAAALAAFLLIRKGGM